MREKDSCFIDYICFIFRCESILMSIVVRVSMVFYRIFFIVLRVLRSRVVCIYYVICYFNFK